MKSFLMIWVQFSILSIGVGQVAFADANFTAYLYGQKNKNNSPWIYKFRHESAQKEGEEIVKNQYVDAQGNLQVIENVKLNGLKVIKYSLTQNQLDEAGEIFPNSNKIHFKYTREGKQKVSEEKEVGNFVIGPTIVRYIESRWSKLKRGERVKIRFGVADRRETVGFDLDYKQEVETRQGRLHEIKMSASTWIIAALVDPLYFYVQEEPFRLKQMKGRMLPKRKIGNKWKDADYFVTYIYDDEIQDQVKEQKIKSSQGN